MKSGNNDFVTDIQKNYLVHEVPEEPALFDRNNDCSDQLGKPNACLELHTPLEIIIGKVKKLFGNNPDDKQYLVNIARHNFDSLNRFE